MAAEKEVSALPAVRRILLAILLLGLLGTGTELFLVGHFEDSWQLIPFVLLGLGLVVIAWQIGRPSYASVRAMQVTMILFVVGGLVGLVLHYRGNMEFQLEANPSLGGLELFWKVMKAKAPPALAPAAMSQLGVLGLAYTYRHAALSRAPGRAISSTGV